MRKILLCVFLSVMVAVVCLTAEVSAAIWPFEETSDKLRKDAKIH